MSPTDNENDRLEAGGQVHEPIWVAHPIDLTHDLNLTDGAVRLYTHMKWRYGQNRCNFEGLKSMSAYLGVSETTISKRIKELEALDWVVVVEVRLGGNYASPYYHVFTSQERAREFRKEFKPKDGQKLRDKPSPESVQFRVSKKGKGGFSKPENRFGNSQSNIYCDGDGRNIYTDGRRNIYTDKLESLELDTLSPSSSIEEEGTHPASNQLWYTPNEGDPILVTVLGKTPKRIKIQLPDGSEVAVTEKRLSEEKPEAAGPTLTADGWRAWGVAVARLIPELEKRYPGNIGMQRSYIKWLAGDMGMDETEARGFTLYIEASDEALYARERWLKRETIEGWLNKFRAGGLYPVYMERAARQLMAEAQPAPEPEPDEDIEYADRDAVRAVLAQIGIGV